MKAEDAYWKSHVAALNREAIPVNAYARQHGLSVSTLYYWRRKLKLAGEQTADANGVGKFIALRVGDGAPLRRAPSAVRTCFRTQHRAPRACVAGGFAGRCRGAEGTIAGPARRPSGGLARRQGAGDARSARLHYPHARTGQAGTPPDVWQQL